MLDVPPDGRLDVVGRRQALSLKCGQHIAQRGDRQDAGGELLGALEAIGHQVEDGVGERLQRRGGGGDLQSTELGERVGWRTDRLRDGPLVYFAVDRKGFGGGRRPDGQREPRCVGPRARCGRDLEVGRAGADGAGRETHLDPIIGRDDDSLAGGFLYHGVGRADGHVDLHGLVGLILQNHRQLEVIAEVEEAGRRRPNHKRQPGCDG